MRAFKCYSPISRNLYVSVDVTFYESIYLKKSETSFQVESLFDQEEISLPAVNEPILSSTSDQN